MEKSSLAGICCPMIKISKFATTNSFIGCEMDVNTSPKYFLNQLEVSPTTELFQKFILLLENKTFLAQFVSISGMYTLDKVLKKTNTDHIQQYIMDSYIFIIKHLPGAFLDHKDVVTSLVNLLIKSRLGYPRVKACKILRKLASTEDGYKVVLDWGFNLYQKITQEPTRFAHLMVMMRLETDHLVLASMIKMIRSLKNHQSEFTTLGFSEVISSLSERSGLAPKLAKLLPPSKTKAQKIRDIIKDDKIWSLVEKILPVEEQVVHDEEEVEAPWMRLTTACFGEFGLEDDLDLGLIVEACPRWTSSKKKAQPVKKQPVQVTSGKLLNMNQNDDLIKILDVLNDYICKSGRNLEFIFKISGKPRKVELLKQDIVAQKDISGYDDPHTVATLFKQFIKDLSIIPFDYYPMFLEVLKYDSTKRLLTLKDLISKLPSFNRIILEKSLFILWLMVRSSEVNKMNSFHMGSIFGGVFFKNSMEKSYNSVVYHMVKSYLVLFNIRLGEGWQEAYQILGSDDEEVETTQLEKGRENEGREGIQLKKNPLTHKWSKSYCVLRDDKLYHYNSMEEYKKGKKPQGVISLAFSVCDKEDRKGHKACYSIFSSGKSYLFEAETDLDRQEWVTAIKTVINK